MAAVVAAAPPPELDLKHLLLQLDEVEELLGAIRLAVTKAAGVPDTDLAPMETVTDGDHGPEDYTLRMLRFLKTFYQAPGRSLTAAEASAAATAAGYDPRGTAGFYVGKNASLVKIDSVRVLTETGRRFYEAHHTNYPELDLPD